MPAGEDYCELSQAYVRIARLNRLLEEANAMLDIALGRVVLSPREKQVMELIARGFSAKEAAGELRISIKTLEDYKTRLMAKLHVHDIVRLTHCAIRLGVVSV